MSIRRLAAAVAAGAAIAAGAAMLVLQASPVSASSGPTTASVTIGSSVTVTDATPAITFATPVALPATEDADMPVNINVLSNDPAGYAVSVVATGTNAVCVGIPDDHYLTDGNCDELPFTDLNVQPNGSGPLVGPPAGFFPQGIYQDVDSSSSASAPGGDVYNDVWQLTIPGNQPPGTYAATLAYSVAGN